MMLPCLGKHRGDDDGIHLVLQQRRQERVGVMVGRHGEQEHLLAHLAQPQRELLQHVGVGRVGDIGHHQPDHICTPGDQAARHHVGRVPQGPRRRQNLCARLCQDLAVLVEAARYGGLRNVRQACSQLGTKDRRYALTVPIAFTSDHMKTLAEID